MKRKLVYCLAVLMILTCGASVCTANEEPLKIKNAQAFMEYLEKKASSKKETIQLENNIVLPYKKNEFLSVRSKSLVIDGQGHSLRYQGDIKTNNLQFSMPSKNNQLKLKDISDLGSFTCSHGKIELEDVTFTGNYCGFVDCQAKLSDVQTSEKNAEEQKYPSISIMNGKMTLDETCSISENWRLLVSNGEAVVDCDYYDAEVTIWAKGSASFSGKGTGKGTLTVMLKDNGTKAKIDARTENLKIYLSDPEFRGRQTAAISGTARSVEIMSFGEVPKNRKLDLKLSGVERLCFILDYHNDPDGIPEDESELHDLIKKSTSRVSLAKITDAEGKPIRSVDYRVLYRGADGKIDRVEWTESLEN